MRPPTPESPFPRAGFAGPPPPYPARTPPAGHLGPSGPSGPTGPGHPPNVAQSSPLLVNLLQTDAPHPAPRHKQPLPAKLERLDDGQVSWVWMWTQFCYGCTEFVRFYARWQIKGDLEHRSSQWDKFVSGFVFCDTCLETCLLALTLSSRFKIKCRLNYLVLGFEPK